MESFRINNNVVLHAILNSEYFIFGVGNLYLVDVIIPIHPSVQSPKDNTSIFVQ